MLQTEKKLFVVSAEGFIDNDAGNAVKDMYYSVTKERSHELIKFNYNHLCLSMDFNYGLKDSHNIEYFDSYFEKTGLKKQLLEGTAGDSVKAINELVKHYIADSHTTISNCTSVYAGKNFDAEDGVSIDLGWAESQLVPLGYSVIRQKCAENPDSKVSTNPFDFTVNGDTCYVTFDNFSPASKDYYALTANGTAMDNLTLDKVSDTYGLLIYAQNYIKNHTEIKNVVIDISVNSGGEISALGYVVAWILGQGNLSFHNTLTGANVTNAYEIDTNLDKQYELEDILFEYTTNDRALKLYCITSKASFSCGNALPLILKRAGTVTLIGQTTGGGACSTKTFNTADGTVFTVSGNKTLCYVTNGSYYHGDKGVEPHHFVNDFTKIYNRSELQGMITNNNW